MIKFDERDNVECDICHSCAIGQFVIYGGGERNKVKNLCEPHLMTGHYKYGWSPLVIYAREFYERFVRQALT